MEMDVEFEGFLRRSNLADNTIKAYVYAVKQYCGRYDKVTKSNLQKYKLFLLENYKPKTVNLRIRALNCYLEAIGKEKLALSSVKVQQKTYLENVISDADYMYFKECLRRDGEWFWYFVIRFLGATGARVSELLQIKIEDLRLGYLDLYTKGGKIRRLYFPRSLCAEAIPWFMERGTRSGFIFLNQHGNLISSRGIELRLKHFAKLYKINPKTVYPHSFRHRFAKNFLKRFNDISLLADLMGHDSIATTRIYLTRSSQEQKALLDRIITW